MEAFFSVNEKPNDDINNLIASLMLLAPAKRPKSGFSWYNPPYLISPDNFHNFNAY